MFSGPKQAVSLHFNMHHSASYTFRSCTLYIHFVFFLSMFSYSPQLHATSLLILKLACLLLFCCCCKRGVYISMELQTLTGPMSIPQIHVCLIHLLISPCVLLNLSITILKMFYAFIYIKVKSSHN